MHEPLQQLFTRSRLMILDFSQIPSDIPHTSNIELFFKESEADGLNPRLPQNRQRFNNGMLQATGARYLVSRYGEDRRAMLAGSKIAAEGRTLHLGIDIFAKDLETVYAPCDGQIVHVGRESDNHSFGYYVILKPDDTDIYMFFGHLSQEQPVPGLLKAGQPFARLGDYINHENGGWSRHLHLQMFTQLPKAGEPLVGYSTQKDLAANRQRFPDPMTYFPDWHTGS